MHPIKLIKYVFFLVLTSNLALYGMSDDEASAFPSLPGGPYVPELPHIVGRSQIDQETARILAEIGEKSHGQPQAKRRRISKEEDSSEQTPSSTTTTTTTSTQSTGVGLLPAVTMPIQQRGEYIQASIVSQAESVATSSAVDQIRTAEEFFTAWLLPKIEDALFRRNSNLANTIAERSKREITLDELNSGIARSPFTFDLRVIAKHNQHITQEQIELIGQRFPNIRELSLANVGLRNDGLTALSEQQIARNLIVLDVRRNKLNADGLDSISNFTNLKALSISHNFRSNKWVKVLAKAPFAANLVQLNVAANGIVSSGIRATLGSFRSLTMLNISANEIHDFGLKVIAKAPFAGNLTLLSVNDAKITAKGVQATIDSFRSLKTFSISGNSIRNAGFEAIAKAPCATNLTELSVAANGITIKGVRAAIDSFTNLKTFYISGNSIKDAGLKAIAKAPFAGNLTQFFVSGTGITAVGLQTSIAPFISLIILDVGNNAIGDAGLEAIARAPFARNLIKLNLADTGITAEGVQANMGVFTSFTSVKTS